MAIQAQFHQDNFRLSLGGFQNFMDDTFDSNEFCFQFPQKQQLQNVEGKFRSPCFDNNDGLLSKRNIDNQSMAFSQIIPARIEKHRQEIDRSIRLQNERLRVALQEQRKQQMSSILRRYEVKLATLLKRKEEEIAKALNRTAELEEFLRRMDIQSQTWLHLSKENEAMVESLYNTIEQIKENACLSNGAEDAESCCETGENKWQHEQENEEERRNKQMSCRSCDSRDSCIIFLPCRVADISAHAKLAKRLWTLAQSVGWRRKLHYIRSPVLIFR